MMQQTVQIGNSPDTAEFTHSLDPRYQWQQRLKMKNHLKVRFNCSIH